MKLIKSEFERFNKNSFPIITKGYIIEKYPFLGICKFHDEWSCYHIPSKLGFLANYNNEKKRGILLKRIEKIMSKLTDADIVRFSKVKKGFSKTNKLGIKLVKLITWAAYCDN